MTHKPHFTPTRNTRGNPILVAVCNDCGKPIKVAAMHGRKGDDGHGQAMAKIRKRGWTCIKNTIRCKECSAQRKAAPQPMPQHDNHPTTHLSQDQALKHPSKDQKRAIMKLLDEVYDTTNERYLAQESDDSVADVLGVMPAWVSDIREEFFGPAGSNEEVDKITARINQWLINAEADLEKVNALAAALETAVADAREHKKTLDNIKSALSDRIRKKAGVK